MFALMRDLRGMGETNAVAARRKTFLRRDTLFAAAARYQELYADADGRIPATFQIIWLTGQPDDLEGGRDAPVRICIEFLIPGGGGEQGIAPQKGFAAGGDRIGFSHPAQVAHQGKHVVIGDGQGIRIDDRSSIRIP